MPMALLIICLVSGVSSFVSFLIDRRRQSQRGQRITYALAVISFVAGVTSAGLNYRASVEAERQLLRAHDQITEIRTPRRMAAETEDMLVARLKPYAGQKYDMKVYRDEDSLELAKGLQAIFEEAGWLYTNVYPRHGTRHSETDDHGVWVMLGNGQTERTAKARSALHDALHEAGLYDDSKLLSPVNCVEGTGPIEQGTKVTRIPCSESEIQITGVHFTVHDDVIPEDTLVLHVGKQRL